MANIVRLRVELKKKYNDPKLNFRDMHAEFKRKAGQAGILHDFKNHQVFTSKSEKERSKRAKSIQRVRMEMLESKIISGERVKAPKGLVKKIMANINKDRRGNKTSREKYDE